MIFKPAWWFWVLWHYPCFPSLEFRHVAWKNMHQPGFCGRAASESFGSTLKSATNQLAQPVRERTGLPKLFSWAGIKLSRVHLGVGILQGLFHKHAPVIGNKFFPFSLCPWFLCTGLCLYKYSRDLGLGGWGRGGSQRKYILTSKDSCFSSFCHLVGFCNRRDILFVFNKAQR